MRGSGLILLTKPKLSLEKLEIEWHLINYTIYRLHNRLHARVNWTTSTRGRYPYNILHWIFNVAGFAMDAILSVDLQIG